MDHRDFDHRDFDHQDFDHQDFVIPSRSQPVKPARASEESAFLDLRYSLRLFLLTDTADVSQRACHQFAPEAAKFLCS
jgi:hypothetical protein